jgi:hypothetical protein
MGLDEIVNGVDGDRRPLSRAGWTSDGLDQAIAVLLPGESQLDELLR